MPVAAFQAAGVPLRGIRRCLRVLGAWAGSVPGGTSNMVVSM